ncbi:MAG TPA: hydroxyacylglutathione hydrolase [Steroidobacteraceae bacterium]|jgi:hydroxyacylglutathione hydrolase|nr:hydroxyacylglutathione hydrolase [Steroidobacteraceae bacterium]
MSFHATHLNVRPVRAFSDNYIWLIESPRDPAQVVAVDPGDAAPVIADLKRSSTSLAAILLTHHHPDHIGGVPELLRHRQVPVVGPNDARIANRSLTVEDGEHCEFEGLGLSFEILQIPGHTLSHIAFWGHGAVFCGDTLFSAGCGRMFEGTPKQMNASLDRLRNLPPETQVYCGHEYTAANLRFALTVEPTNAAALEYQESVARIRAAGSPTLPSSLSLEIRVNPFLRCDKPGIRATAEQRAGTKLETPEEVFAVLRAWKDQFR